MYGESNYGGSDEQLPYVFAAEFWPLPPGIIKPEVPMTSTTNYNCLQQQLLQPPHPVAAAALSYLPPIAIPTVAEFGGYTPPAPAAAAAATTSYSCSGGGYESPSSLESNYSSPRLMQRSFSSHSLPHVQMVNQGSTFNQLISSSTAITAAASATAAASELLDSETCSMRRAFSANNLQGRNLEQNHDRLESNSIIEGMSKACRYSPEEKRERIERYRSKRNQRNFNKKIKYVCRKTLADSRPRIRGRFARNDEIEKAQEINHYSSEQITVAEEDFDDDDDSNWINLLASFSANLIP